jgi:hypothetical protein
MGPVTLLTVGMRASCAGAAMLDCTAARAVRGSGAPESAALPRDSPDAVRRDIVRLSPFPVALEIAHGEDQGEEPGRRA